MTVKQKIELRLSEVRSRLNEIAGVEGEAFTDEIRNESTALQTEYADLESRHRAAIIAEADEQRAAEGEFRDGDGESAEVRSLLERVSITDYLQPAGAGLGLTGAAAELNAALEVPVTGGAGGVAVPWRVIAGPDETREANGNETERRAFTGTGDYAGGVQARPILQRLFGRDILGALGVRIDSVPAGRTEWPLLSGGVSPAMKAEGTAAADAVSASFATEVLKPKRLTGKYEFTHEQAAQVPGIEAALRRDLGDAVRAKMSDLALNGDESTNAHEPDGFLHKLAAPTAPGAVADYAAYAGVPASGVDGIHASDESECAFVMGVASYQHAAAVYRTGAGAESAIESLKRRAGRVMASSFVPAAASDIQNGNILHAAGPNGGDMRGDSVAAVWPSLELIRDPYSKASQGITLSWVTLWDLEAAFRSGAYKRVSFKLA